MYSSSEKAPAVNVSGLTKQFGGRIAVNSLTMSIPAGSIFGFLGPNGSGKTTTIRMLCGLLTPDAGMGTCLGFDVGKQSRAIRRHIGYMPQKFSLYDDLTIIENLRFMRSVYGVADRNCIDREIQRFKLAPFLNRLAGTLSGGWKQKLSLAACLLHKPKLLFLDEPTAGVDPSARKIFWDLLHELASEDITVLVSTHYMDEAERCHQLACIAYGELLAEGAVDDIIRAQSLSTYQLRCEDPYAISIRLRAMSQVDAVIQYGRVLHVSTRSPEAISTIIDGLAADEIRIDPVPTSLEDAFIYLMKDSEPPA